MKKVRARSLGGCPCAKVLVEEADGEVTAEEGSVDVVVDGGSERVDGVVAKRLLARFVVGMDWEPASRNGPAKGRSRVVGRNIVIVIVEVELRGARCRPRVSRELRILLAILTAFPIRRCGCENRRTTAE